MTISNLISECKTHWLNYYEKVYLELSLSPLLSCCELRVSSSCDFIIDRVRVLGRFIARTLSVGIRAAGEGWCDVVLVSIPLKTTSKSIEILS
jgi:hypothetical protein